MFPRNENRNEGTFGCSLERKPERAYGRVFPQNENRNEGTFAKTTLLRNRPFVSQRQIEQSIQNTEVASAMVAFLEAQQRYFSYRAILVAIVSQNSLVLVFMGYRTIIARYVAKWGIARMCLCKTKYQGGVSHPFAGVLASLKKYRAIWGIAAIVSQYRAIWGH